MCSTLDLDAPAGDGAGDSPPVPLGSCFSERKKGKLKYVQIVTITFQNSAIPFFPMLDKRPVSQSVIVASSISFENQKYNVAMLV